MRIRKTCLVLAGATLIVLAACGGEPEVVLLPATPSATLAPPMATASATAMPSRAPTAPPTQLPPSLTAIPEPATATPTADVPPAPSVTPASTSIQPSATPTPVPATSTTTPPPTPPPPTATASPSPTHPGIGQSPPDDDTNATFLLTPGGAPQTATGEVSYPLGDTVDRIVYVVEELGTGAAAPALQLAVSCRFFGDRQFIVRVDGESFTRACGTIIEIPLQPRIEPGLHSGLITISAPGLGPTRVEWTITATMLAPG